MRVLVTIIAVALLALTANAWWCTAHMAIAAIAKQQVSSSVASKLESIASALSASGPFPKSPDFMQSACWADDLKSFGLTSMATWHFINQPYDPSNFPISKWPIQDENVETIITQMDETIKKTNEPTWDLNFALGNLVHMYGDIHQPLHATELFSSTYPDGDHGGNLINVTCDGQKTVLHDIWDSVCWEYTTELPRPLTSSGVDTVNTFVSYLLKTYTFTKQQMDVYNSTVFAVESFNDAVSTAYPNTYSGMTISAAYLAACKPVAEARVALAGYRLGYQLGFLFGDSAEPLTDEKKREVAKKIRHHIVRTQVAMRNFHATHKEELRSRLRKVMH